MLPFVGPLETCHILRECFSETVFNYHAGSLGNASTIIQKMEGSFDKCLVIRRINEYQVKSSTRCSQKTETMENIPFQNGGLLLQEAGANVANKDLDGLRMVVNKHGGCRSPAEGLDAKATSAGKQVKYNCTSRKRCKDVKDGFSQVICRRADSEPTQGMKLPALQGTGYNPHAYSS